VHWFIPPVTSPLFTGREFDIEVVAHNLDRWSFRGRLRNIRPQFGGATVNQNTARFLPCFLLQQAQVVAKLSKISYGRGVLLALYDHRALVSIEKQDVKTRSIYEYPFANLLTWVKHKPILKPVGVCGYEVRKRHLIRKMRKQTGPIRWVIHGIAKICNGYGMNLRDRRAEFSGGEPRGLRKENDLVSTVRTSGHVPADKNATPHFTVWIASCRRYEWLPVVVVHQFAGHLTDTPDPVAPKRDDDVISDGNPL